MLFVLLLIIEIFVLYLLSRRVTKKVHQLFYRLTKSEKWTNYLFAVFFLPGTFLHEVAHFLVALFLLVPVGQLELVPEMEEENKLKMGSVPVAKTDFLRRAAIGIAPFVFGLALIFVSLAWVKSQNLFANYLVVIFLGYLVFEVGNTMFASSKDLEGAWILLVVFLLAFLLLYLLGIRISLDSASFLSSGLLALIKKANIFLLVPIIIDFVVISLLQFFTKSV
jgi:hypothetical protein